MPATLSPVKHASAPRLEVKATVDGKVTGYGSVFDVVDSYKERVIKGAFVQSLGEHRANGTMPKLLWQHRSDVPIGRWDTMQEDQRGLFMEGRLNLKTTAGRDAYEHLVGGDIDGFSIGYRERQVRPGEIRDLVELDLVEVSVVTVPANPAAVVETIKSLGSKAELVDLLRTGGLSKQAAQRIAAGGWKALSGGDSYDTAAADRLAAQIDHATRQMEAL